MEIGPIPGIRAVQAVRAPSREARPQAVFNIDASAKPGDGDGPKYGRKAAGAEEDEEDVLIEDGEMEPGREAIEDVRPSRVNYFA